MIVCNELCGVGPKTLERLKRLNLHCIQDLLFHLPLRYEDRTKISLIRELKIGEYAVVVGTIINTEIVCRGRLVLYCTLSDVSGSLQLGFFNFTKQKLQFRLKPGVRLYCYGELRWLGHTVGMVHPEYRVLLPDENPPIAKSLTSVYPTTDGLSQTILRKLISQALNIVRKNRAQFECFPAPLLEKLKFPDLVDALNFIHEPPSNLDPKSILSRNHPMRKRLIFEELLAIQLSLLRLRREAKTHVGVPLTWDSEFATRFLASLPFTLTNAQVKVIHEIAEDLKASKPMLRLLQGDVGCGKTIVATLVIAEVVNHGYQAVVMAPTELLATQHFKNITHWLTPFKIRTVLLSGKIKGKKRLVTEENIATGFAQVIIGTHVLFQEKVKFKHLALIIIDEQHRFGVHQRLRLQEKGLQNNTYTYPHQLIMTATPIPRTLALTIYADLDCSTIDELPKERQHITTVLISNKRRYEVLERVRSNCREGKQAYWVCPLIEESESLQCQAAETLAEELVKSLPELRVGLVHGRKLSLDKEKVMADFLAHKIDLLVATTVIEVGVDVANASLMIVENAERLGLVQLHQLRGRVGRGNAASFCVLMYQVPLSQQAKQRLSLLRNTQDGFLIAREDLKIRGAGEVLGTKQTGVLELKIANLLADQYLIPEIQKVALSLLQQYSSIAETVIERWIGSKEKYGHVI
ncbi:MAG: ATP-dependent DNA helicase RecG [Coxiellaceae bacterium]|jgi:ATP-dependent DNA helicase RecG|nr:ATP-dependent DNA helicase RecG [Coxiellaceae bacterium]